MSGQTRFTGEMMVEHLIIEFMIYNRLMQVNGDPKQKQIINFQIGIFFNASFYELKAEKLTAGLRFM